MKKFLTVAILLSSVLAGKAQSSLNDGHERFFRIGAKGGVNINKITGKSYKQQFSYNYQLGAFAQFNFSSRFGIQPEVNFVQTTAEVTDDQTTVGDDLLFDGSQKSAKMDYLEIPVLLNINIGSSKKVKLQLGPSYGALINKIVDSSQNNIYKGGDWSAIGGLWIQLPIVNLGARYKLGLTDINNTSINEKWTNQSFQIFVGITL
ncbi:MAG: PorT family protein [Sphingobacteriales bacterium]|nr:PorT family protein [Sphingobacteriales bacterium]